MAINDALTRLKTESKHICCEKEIEKRAENITKSSQKVEIDKQPNSKLKRIALAFNKMDRDYWEYLLKKHNDELEKCPKEEKEAYIEKAVYEIQRMEAIYNGYRLILSEPHRFDEHLKKLNAELKHMDLEYESKALKYEQLKI